MENSLLISILFLANCFHGKSDHGHNEWPPSPFRLYQALVNALCRKGMNYSELLKWFEQLGPPLIISPPKMIQNKDKIVYVPNNNSDKINSKHRKIEKNFRSVIITGNKPVVSYIWKLTENDYANAKEITGLVSFITHLGWGIDLVAGHGKILNVQEKDQLIDRHEGEIWEQSRRKGIALRVPIKGSLANLKNVFQSQRSAIKITNKELYYETPLKPVTYGRVFYSRNKLASRPTACFIMLNPEDTQSRISFPAIDCVKISSWIRSKCCEIAKKGFIPKLDSRKFVAGHLDSRQNALMPRFSYLPLPSIGHEHVDGRIRRVIIAEPYDGDGCAAEWVSNNLNGQTIYDSQNCAKCVLLSVSVSRDKMFCRYRSLGKRFCSVTPVILPGFDSLNYKKADRLFEKSIMQAGFSLGDIVDFELRKAPYFSGASHPINYKRAKHFEHFSSMHAEVIFKKEIQGPLSLGAGRYRGLGLFTCLE